MNKQGRDIYSEIRKIEEGTVERNTRENPLTRAWKVLGGRFDAVINFRSSGFVYGGRRLPGSDAFRMYVVAVKNDRITDWSWVETKGAHKAPSVKKESVRFQLKVADKYKHVGGRDIKPESTIELKNQFNLREVQSGNWVLRDEREKINMAMERLLAVIKKDDLLAKAAAIMDREN